MESINRVPQTYHTPLKEPNYQSNLTVFIERFKLHSSYKIRIIPSRRMANIINKTKPEELSMFILAFIYGNRGRGNMKFENISLSATEFPESGDIELCESKYDHGAPFSLRFVKKVCNDYNHCKD
ncbi:hypothetical protein AYI69_g2316 [Smittium culicis]|uniref:Uncharacterized protein n=1 Tax=Smittium culicis TaxID=133412 RepID=A0A1R1YMW4_9FUNG|nr:hypothetical protein AYI69_g2316 [Smittium culicis]